ncbi:flagellar hook-associated protein FlgL [Wenzhouxiangella limi]|uniref:Flagellar hook-associated protein 3 n=1 Tax=Wenzhouxiangella limi TaxID=2707351 RepID=A0A845V1X5_9GAMM|nr:flagellar hook-associated protein FlgL [Wenzhouxiangella limi]NDY97108.1 flagellar hook-associated protein 3 [Wenzhouxiangella limi]
MRISTAQIYQQGLSGILRQQSSLNQTQLQLSTGRKINSPSDDPVGAARLQTLERGVQSQEVYDRNVSRTRQRLQVEESAIQSAGELIQRVRELTVQASNAPLSDGDRGQIAVELRQRLDQMVAIANTRDGDGEFIFAGAQAGTQPFVREGGDIEYKGDSIQRELSIGPGITMRDGDTGDKVFMGIRDGNGVVSAGQADGNTGTGFVAVENAISVADYPSERYTVDFINGTQFNVLDGNGAQIGPSQSYVDGDTISLPPGPGGAEITLTGPATDDDSFAVTLRTDNNEVVQAGLGPDNTGNMEFSVTSAISPASYDRADYSIEFVNEDSFVVLDNEGFRLLPTTGTDPLDDGERAFASGETISFNGVNLTLRGNPEVGDQFTVEPAANQSVFATLDDLIVALESGSGTPAEAAVQRQGIDDALARLDRIETRFLEVRSDIGGRLNTLDSVEESIAEQSLSLETLVSEVRDLDYAEAITRLQQELVTLQAAQQSFVRIQGLSLFQFLR